MNVASCRCVGRVHVLQSTIDLLSHRSNEKKSSDFHLHRCLCSIPHFRQSHLYPSFSSLSSPTSPPKYPTISALGNGSSGVVGTGLGISTCDSSFSPSLRAGRHESPSFPLPLESLLFSCWLLAASSWVVRWFAHALYIRRVIYSLIYLV